jgi:hypothetical protein
MSIALRLNGFLVALALSHAIAGADDLRAQPAASSGDPAIASLIGNTLVVVGKEDEAIAFLEAGGTVKIVDKGRRLTGKWRAKDGDLCWTFDPADEEDCYRVEVTGTNARLSGIGSNERQLEFTVIPGNDKGL